MDNCDPWSLNLPHVQNQLGYRFFDPTYIKNACTHPSLLNELPHQEVDNQRLEFLGDAVLGLIVAKHLFDLAPQMTVGQMTRMRARVVDKNACCEYARALQISQFLRLGRGERSLTSAILADFFEALVGAIFCDGGLIPAQTFVLRACRSRIERAIAGQGEIDFKSKLQIQSQKQLQQTPIYRVVSKVGPAHRSLITVHVEIGTQIWGDGAGSSKKSAEQRAARSALEKLDAVTSEEKREP